ERPTGPPTRTPVRGNAITPTTGGARVLAVESDRATAHAALLRSRERDSHSDGDYRLLGSLTKASQLASEMLAETRRTSKRLSRTRRRGSVSGRVSQRLGQHQPLVVPLRRQHRGGDPPPPRCGLGGPCPREARERPVGADANLPGIEVCPRGKALRTVARTVVQPYSSRKRRPTRDPLRSPRGTFATP